MNSPKVVIHKSVLAGFRRRAWKTYPKEHVEAIFGIIHSDHFEIHVFLPVPIIKAHNHYVTYEPPLDEDIEDTKCELLGYIHTHTGLNTCGHPSDHDNLTAVQDGDKIHAICWLYKLNGVRRSRTRFEVPNTKLVLEISNN